MNKKVGIFAPVQAGDIMTAMSVLKYSNDLWPGMDIVWFCEEDRSDALKFSPISEVRPWAGVNYMDLKTNSGVGLGMNRMDTRKSKCIPSTSDLELGYFPLPWMLERTEQRQGMTLPEVSKRIFGINDALPWRPCLFFSESERQTVREMMSTLPYKRTVMLENSPCSYSAWDDSITRTVMSMCRERWGNVNFVFASGGNHRSGNDMSRFFDDHGCISGSHLTARQVSLANEYCDLFAGVAGALTFATSCWGAKPTPKLIYTGSEIFGARGISNGKIEIVAMDRHGHNRNSAENDLRIKLNKLLSEIP